MVGSLASTLTAPLLVLLLVLLTQAKAQNAALGGGAGIVAPVASQYPTIIVGPSLSTNAAGATTVIRGPFTQTFKSPLGTWAFATPSPGAIGLGNIQGTVGDVRG